MLLAFALPLNLGALISDFAYRGTFHVQWANFSSWLIAGGLFVTAFAVLWAFIGLFTRRTDAHTSRGRDITYFVVLLAMWLIGFANALVHAKDAWATMPEGLLLSAVTTLLALVATWIGYSRNEEAH